MNKTLITYAISLLSLSLIGNYCLAGDVSNGIIKNKKSKGIHEIERKSYYEFGRIPLSEFNKQMELNAKSKNGTTYKGSLDDYKSFAKAIDTQANKVTIN
jgi:hypothetical protein